MQINRLFEIVYLLLDKRIVTAKSLAEYFEVSQRTIYRDVDVLCQAGIPIYTTKGKGGGIQLLDSFVLKKSLLSGEEQDELLSALEGLNAVKYPDVRSVLSKLNGLFGERDTSWIEVDFSDWGRDRKEVFSNIKTALLSRRLLHFDYFGSSGELTSRTVEPVQLWFRGKAWYLRAYCRDRQGQRTFKIARMKEVSVSEEQFQKREGEDTQAEGENRIGTDWQEENMQVVELSLWIDRSQAYRVYDEFEEEEISRAEDGSFLVKVSYPENEWVYGMILSYGKWMEVQGPERIRKLIGGRLAEAAARYR